MKITELPYNAFLGIEELGGDGELQLPDNSRYTNHVGTVHASALYSLAEAASGSFLLTRPGIDVEKVGALMRTASIKYRKPATGCIRSRTGCAEGALETLQSNLAARGRAKIAIDVELIDADEQVVAAGDFEWFVSRLES